MVDANLLMGIAFSIITNFTSQVPVPEDCIPKSTNDFKKYVIGTPYSPIDIGVWCRGGAQYVVCDGIVNYFDSNRSVFGEQDPDRLGAYNGISIVSSNQALTIASNALQRLIKPNFALSNATPRIHQAGIYDWLPSSQWSPMPFFEVDWPSVSDAPHGANVEIDGRNGRIVGLHLHDIAYRDFAFSEKIKRQVYVPEPRATTVAQTNISRVKKFHLPQPTAAYVARAITNWLGFCRRIGCGPGTQTNVSSINWDETWFYTNRIISTSSPVCRIRFQNGAYFESIDGVTFSHFGADGCFTGHWMEKTSQEWAPFWGKCTKDWKDWKALAKALEPIIVEQLGIPKELLAPYSPWLGTKPPELGKYGVTRILVEWRNWPVNPGRTVYTSETKLAFRAEFDLETGALKWIDFFKEDPKFVEALRIAAAKHNHL